MCIVQAEDRVFYVIILLSGNLTLQSLLFIAIFRCLMKRHMDMRCPCYFFCPVSIVFNLRTIE